METEISENEISLGINIGAYKTVYSTFFKENKNYFTNVLLMNNSSRIIPSIICYSLDHRLFGDNSIILLNKNIKTSYNNLSRIFGFDKNLKIFKDEHLFALQYMNKINEFKFESKDLKISTSNLITDFLFLISEYFFIKEKIKYTFSNISIPDFYHLNQKQNLKLICESINLKDTNLFSESSSITMYYGYTKYKDNFIQESNKIDTSIIKKILFIDSGHSKTSFILSQFKYNEFKVNYVLCNPFLGGRNFDYLIFEYCIEEFKKINNIDNIEITSNMKYKLIETIRNERINLTDNKEILITVNSFYNGLDLNINFSLKNMEKINELPNKLERNLIEEFENDLNKILDYSINNNIQIDCVEIAGEFVRNPIFQNIIEKYNLKILKSIVVDECCSVGSSLLGIFIKRKLPIKELKYFYCYNYFSLNYEIFFDDKKIIEKELFNKGVVDYKEKIIQFENYINVNCIILRIFYPENEKEVQSHKNYYLKYTININKLLEEKEDIDNLIFKIEVNENHTFSSGKFFVSENKQIKKHIKKSVGEIYKLKDEQELFKEKVRKYVKYQEDYDFQFNSLINEKINVSKEFFEIKNIVENNNLDDEIIQIQNIEKLLNEKNLNLDSLNDIRNQIDDLKKRINKE